MRGSVIDQLWQIPLVVIAAVLVAAAVRDLFRNRPRRW